MSVISNGRTPIYPGRYGKQYYSKIELLLSLGMSAYFLSKDGERKIATKIFTSDVLNKSSFIICEIPEYDAMYGSGKEVVNPNIIELINEATLPD